MQKTIAKIKTLLISSLILYTVNYPATAEISSQDRKVTIEFTNSWSDEDPYAIYSFSDGISGELFWTGNLSVSGELYWEALISDILILL